MSNTWPCFRQEGALGVLVSLVLTPALCARGWGSCRAVLAAASPRAIAAEHLLPLHRQGHAEGLALQGGPTAKPQRWAIGAPGGVTGSSSELGVLLLLGQEGHGDPGTPDCMGKFQMLRRHRTYDLACGCDLLCVPRASVKMLLFLVCCDFSIVKFNFFVNTSEI